MSLPSLLHRRYVWVPTWFGLFLLLMFMIVAFVVAGRNLYRFLAVTDPLGADILVVEGWMPEEGLQESIRWFKSNNIRYLVTTGGPITQWREFVPFTSYADFAANFVTRHEISVNSVTAVPAPASKQDRTFLSAVMVRKWVKGLSEDFPAIDVYSYGPHARRTRLNYELAFGPDVRIGILSATPDHYGVDSWWKSTEGVKAIVMESSAWLWTKCCFSPPKQGSHDEMWGRK